MARRLVITVDHEVFGNGTGDVRQHIVEPTERMCGLAERYGVPITIFFELEEYLQFERHADELRQSLGYDPAAEMRQQASDLARRGHDLQLHLHPQWYEAERRDSAWQLRNDHLTVDSLFGTVELTTEFIRERRMILEEISGKPVIAYRAGGFAAQPADRLLKALSETGFKIDSSVVKGMHRPLPQPLDYRGAPAGRRLWRISEEVEQEDPRGPLWEIPIHSKMGRRFQQLSVSRLKAKFSRNIPKARQKEMIDELGIGRTPASVVSFLASQVPIKLDYHNLKPEALMKMVKRVPAPPAGDLDVLVLIGHSKEHIDDRMFEDLLRRIKEDPSLEVITMSRCAELLGRESPSKKGAGCADSVNAAPNRTEHGG